MCYYTCIKVLNGGTVQVVTVIGCWLSVFGYVLAMCPIGQKG